MFLFCSECDYLNPFFAEMWMNKLVKTIGCWPCFLSVCVEHALFVVNVAVQILFHICWCQCNMYEIPLHVLYHFRYNYLFFIFRACGERPFCETACCLILVFSVLFFVTSTVPTWYQAEWALYHLVRLDGYFADQLGLSDVNLDEFTPEDLLEPLASRQFGDEDHFCFVDSVVAIFERKKPKKHVLLICEFNLKSLPIWSFWDAGKPFIPTDAQQILFKNGECNPLKRSNVTIWLFCDVHSQLKMVVS